MNTPNQTPADKRIDQLEDELADRHLPSPPADLKRRVMTGIRRELTSPAHSNGWWPFVGSAAAILILGANLALSAGSSVNLDQYAAIDRLAVQQNAEQISHLLPELDRREAWRQAWMLQSASRSVPLPYLDGNVYLANR